MKTSAIFTAFAALAGLVIAAPAADTSPVAIPARAVEESPPPLSYQQVVPIVDAEEAAIAKREIEARQGVFITVHVNWSGGNAYISPINRGACADLVSSWKNVITSFGPDPGLVCWIYDGDWCTGYSYGPIYNPGFADLSSIGMNDRINSFICW
ncbi:hypothetical protein QBC40DRAFT_301545 [Triangularia verruculosa]|uniref:Uncharacterized protein n=1 Tax=Triangularia verruculosa TaxID=2587418 RepID=A0AAN6X8N1_9PEZI|nr:hypothetical protein QBC40DRAFT_301545 [Triangularia verruculosa]